MDEEEQWKVFDFVEDFFMEELEIGDYINDINSYHLHMFDKHDVTTKKLDVIVEKAGKVDANYAAQIEGYCSLLGEYGKKFETVCAMLALDFIRVIPVIGALKYLDAIGTLFKNADKVSVVARSTDGAGVLAKHADEAAAWLHGVKGRSQKVGYEDVWDLRNVGDALETSYGKSTLNSLKNTENFTESAIEHIFEGQVNARGKAVGYHYEGIEGTSGNVIPGTESSVNNIGVYKAQVEVNGIPKTANGGFSTFYSKNLSPQQVVDAINEAYSNCELKLGTRNTYQGVANNGMKIDMFLDQSGKIISAFPEE